MSEERDARRRYVYETMTEREPRTEAGKAFDLAWPGGVSQIDRLSWRERILAIEEQAASPAVPDGLDPWERLIAAIREHKAWMAHGDYRPSMSAYVGVTDDGDYFAGAHIEGEWWEDERDGQEDGASPAEVIDRQIAAMARHREERDRERAEWDVEYATPQEPESRPEEGR